MRLIILSILFINISCNKSTVFAEKSKIYSLVYAEKIDKFPRNISKQNEINKLEFITGKYAVNEVPVKIKLAVKNIIIEKLGKDFFVVNHDLNSFHKIFKNEKLTNKPNLNIEEKAALNMIGTISLSNIYLSEDRRSAILIMNTFREKLDSNSVLFELEKLNDGWAIKYKRTLSFS